MQNGSPFFGKLAMTVWVVLVSLLGIFMFPWKMMNWGTLKFGTDRTITVSGTAETKTKNQIASFTAGVSANNDKKEDAVKEVNTKMDEIVKQVKAFGIKPEDIQTQNNSIFQQQEPFYDNGVQKTRPGQWSVNNSIEITLREVDRASDLADLLAKTGANNVYGPNFMMDQTTTFEAALATQAIEDARKKAASMAKDSGATLGEVVTITEGASSQPIMFAKASGMGGGGGPSVVEPGSSTVSKTVTVTFRLN